MTARKVLVIAKCVKVIEDAIGKFKSVPNFHKALVRAGVEISQPALYDLQKGVAKSIKPDLACAICHLVYGGDWRKCGKALETDFLVDSLK